MVAKHIHVVLFNFWMHVNCRYLKKNRNEKEQSVFKAIYTLK